MASQRIKYCDALLRCKGDKSFGSLCCFVRTVCKLPFHYKHTRRLMMSFNLWVLKMNKPNARTNNVELSTLFIYRVSIIFAIEQ